MNPVKDYRITGSWILILLLSIPHIPSRAAGDNYPAGARSASMGSLGVMCPGFWSIWQNQAGLGFYSHPAAGIHHENRFMLPEFGLSCLGISLPTPTGTLGFSWSHFGYTAYREDKIGLALGKAFHEKFAVGLQLDYLNTFLADETGNRGTVALEAGILAEAAENLWIGFHVFNPTAARLPGMKNEHVPVILRMGLGYTFGEKLFMGTETEKDLELGKACFKTGLEYRLNKYIYLRTGISVQYHVQHSFGLGFLRQNFQADLAFSFQPVLGYSPYLSFLYVFK